MTLPFRSFAAVAAAALSSMVVPAARPEASSERNWPTGSAAYIPKRKKLKRYMKRHNKKDRRK